MMKLHFLTQKHYIGGTTHKFSNSILSQLKLFITKCFSILLSGVTQQTKIKHNALFSKFQTYCFFLNGQIIKGNVKLFKISTIAMQFLL